MAGFIPTSVFAIQYSVFILRFTLILPSVKDPANVR
jgi:hypothetical protein